MKQEENNFLKDNNEDPLVVFHSTGSDIEAGDFFPLTNFGTAKAAQRMHLARSSNDKVYACILEMKKPLHVADGWGEYTTISPYSIIDAGGTMEDVRWAFSPLMRHPVISILFDRATEIDSRNYNHNKLNKINMDLPNSISLAADFAARVLPKSLILQAMSLSEVRKELENEGLFETEDAKIEVLREVDRLDAERRRYGSQPLVTKDIPYFEETELRKRLATQRSISVLEKLGYDGLVYTNAHEDPGSNTYCIFRPNQAHFAIGHELLPNGIPDQGVNFVSAPEF